MTFNSISGDVVYGVWIERPKEKTIEILEGGNFEKTARPYPTLIVVLDSVNGVDDKQRKMLNSQFLLSMDTSGVIARASTSVLRKVQDEKSQLLILVIPCEKIPDGIKINSQFEIKDITYRDDEWGGIIYEKGEILIKTVKKN